MKKRNINLDLIRVCAIFSVISVHFFLHTGFYEINIHGLQSFILILFRTLFMICVPLFLLLTGYLMNKKTLSKKYYFGIIRIIFIFIVAKIGYLLVDKFYFNNIDSFLTLLRHIFSYSSSYYNDYSWYVNMYIGLFLLIPFLNLIYNNLTNKKQKQILIITLVFLTSVATVTFKGLTIFLDWWSGFYPLTYYFIGAYICEYGFNIKKGFTVLLLVLVLLMSTIFYFMISYNKTFVTKTFTEYIGPTTLIIVILIFGLLLNINTKKFPKTINKFITKVSQVSFSMYLFSYIIDKIVYQKFNGWVLDINSRFAYYFLIVPLIFLITFFLSIVVDDIYNKFIKSKVESLINED